jgi:HEAT repeat protein
MSARGWAAVLACLLTAIVLRGQEREAVAPGDLQAAISRLGDLDYPTRMNAARTVRRASADQAVPALMKAAAEHADGYVRFRALVLLSGFNDSSTAGLMRRVMTDQNDRLRQVAFGYFEHNPDPSSIPALLQALQREESEFVRPELTRALAALGSDPRVRETLLAEVDRGVDFFRSAVIEALGDFRAAYAVPALIRIARLDGPLQDDAALALGRIGDKTALEVLSALQRTAPRNSQPSIAAAICLLGVNCSSHQRYIEETLRFAIQNPGFQDLLRSAANGLAALASHGNAPALTTLLDAGIPSLDPARAPIALAVGTVAIRNTVVLVGVLEKRTDVDQAVLLLREAFDMLEEDFEEERFFVTMRRTYWEAAPGSPTRRTAEALIQKLEF